MLLYLMRHGQAASKLEDPAGGLSALGRADIERLAYSLAARGIYFDHVIHSPKTRAAQTALIMRTTISPKSTVRMEEHVKPNDNPDIILAELENWRQPTLVVGHLPFMPSLVRLLTGPNETTSAIDFEPGTVVCLQRGEGNKWPIEWVSSPSML
ncbi:MAG: phosphohistidine phosphatase SixA [Acidiferrobacterales bacterium]